MWTPVRKEVFTVEFLSPVHIGTGEQLGLHDLLVEGGRIVRLRGEQIVESLAADPVLLDRFVREGAAAVAGRVRGRGLLAPLYEVRVPRPPDLSREAVRAFVADHLRRPYVPGTAVKGAIRTALAWSILKRDGASAYRAVVGMRRSRRGELEPEQDRREAGGLLAQQLLGEDPKQDVLRSVRVTDGSGIDPRGLKVLPFLVAVSSGGRLQWLRSPRRRDAPSVYTNRVEEAIANFCECLDADSSGAMEVSIELDAFLLEASIERGRPEPVAGHLGWEGRKDAVAGWGSACTEFAREVAQRELRWWERMGPVPAANAVVSFYRKLLALLGEPRAGIVLNVGWAGGWQTKTVTWEFGDGVVSEVVRNYALDRRAGSRPFPKTRRLAWRGGEDFVPPGWIRLVPKGGRDARG